MEEPPIEVTPLMAKLQGHCTTQDKGRAVRRAHYGHPDTVYSLALYSLGTVTTLLSLTFEHDWIPIRDLLHIIQLQNIDILELSIDDSNSKSEAMLVLHQGRSASELRLESLTTCKWIAPLLLEEGLDGASVLRTAPRIHAPAA
ncbi:hypothetical protein PUNSTDRAFT_137410 [Punctularia strigosozonata HHB-11173 SS5]|uniref:uncharacterized protein n=1 Tax=Punctularia strigosozonata (strain HHB-11173) TaxID=741275 RepID=UPI0004417DE8|nr:uncharacterized protein PUNSTDRAFT_137410 [Punctularia strigosozonata HHB-11173 SS5]EIN05925.1 hypothetical protein PUNSTDRAFT_137410 [Punctularia strigosozonata HHB-11173 SS5]